MTQYLILFSISLSIQEKPSIFFSIWSFQYLKNTILVPGSGESWQPCSWRFLGFETSGRVFSYPIGLNELGLRYYIVRCSRIKITITIYPIQTAQASRRILANSFLLSTQPLLLFGRRISIGGRNRAFPICCQKNASMLFFKLDHSQPLFALVYIPG